MSPSFRKILCNRDEIPESGCKGFDVEGFPLFAVKKRQRIHLYQNRCPHRGLPLNWVPDGFLDRDRELIQCTSHGALFRIENGECVAGPCPGQHLRAIEHEEIDGLICVDPDHLGP